MQTLHSTAQAAAWLRQRVTGELRTDSRQVQPPMADAFWRRPWRKVPMHA